MGWEARQPMDVVFSDQPKSVPLGDWLDRLHDARVIAGRNSAKKAGKTKARVDKSRIGSSFKVGDIVRARVLVGIRRDPEGTREHEKERSIKFAWKFRGPYKIIALDGHQAHLVRPMNSHATKIANIDDIEPYWTSARLDRLMSGNADAKATDEIEEDVYFIRAIKAHRDTKQGKREYCVAWEGFDDLKADTWEPMDSFNELELIEDYELGLLRGAFPLESRFNEVYREGEIRRNRALRNNSKSQGDDVACGEESQLAMPFESDQLKSVVKKRQPSKERTNTLATIEVPSLDSSDSTSAKTKRDKFRKKKRDIGTHGESHQSPPPSTVAPPKIRKSARLSGKRVRFHVTAVDQSALGVRDTLIDQAIDNDGISFAFL
jgi:hypothetical protein